MRIQPTVIALKGRVHPLALIRLIDAETEEEIRMSEIKQPKPITGYPGGTMTPPPRPK